MNCSYYYFCSSSVQTRATSEMNFPRSEGLITTSILFPTPAEFKTHTSPHGNINLTNIDYNSWYVKDTNYIAISYSRIDCALTHETVNHFKITKTSKQMMIWIYCGLRLRRSVQENVLLAWNVLAVILGIFNIYSSNWLNYWSHTDAAS